jgi:hypothetical protein
MPPIGTGVATTRYTTQSTDRSKRREASTGRAGAEETRGNMTLAMLERAVEAMKQAADTKGLDYEDITIEARIGQGKIRTVTGWSWCKAGFFGVNFHVM